MAHARSISRPAPRCSLRVEPIDDAEPVRWTLRCDTLHGLRHRSLASLVDYGPIGQGRRFEAWAVEGLWTGADEARRRARASAAAFLTGCHLSIDHDAGGVYRTAAGRPVVVPGAGAGFPAERERREVDAVAATAAFR